MDSNYVALNNRVNTAISEHLLTLSALPPNADVPLWSQTITGVVFDALRAGGLTQEIIETVGKKTQAAGKTQGS